MVVVVGVHGVELRSKKKERGERGMARGARALMHSLCAGRVLLQNTHSHKHISTLRAPFARVKGHPGRPSPDFHRCSSLWRPETRRNISESCSRSLNFFSLRNAHLIFIFKKCNGENIAFSPPINCL